MSSHDRAGSLSTRPRPGQELTALLMRLQEVLSAVEVKDIPPQAAQQLMTMAVATYCALRQAGLDIGPFVDDEAVSVPMSWW